MMEYDEETNQFDVEFCPVEHPVEPEEEDRPVKCPVPVSSSLIHVSLVSWKFNYTKISHFNDYIIVKSILTVKKSMEKSKPGWVKHRDSYETPVYPPPRQHVRNVRKRHNSFDVEGNSNFFTRSHDDETTSRRSNVTIYRVLQQVHEFEPWTCQISYALRF